MNTRVNDNANEKLTLTVGSHWDILPGLSFDPQVSLYNVSDDFYTFQPGFWNGPLAYVDSRIASAGNARWRQAQADGVFSYNKTFSTVHNLDAKAGISFFDRRSSNLSASGRGASTDLIPTLNASGEATAVSSTITDQTILGYFASANYNYDLEVPFIRKYAL